jgi:hypothetical protein
VTLLILTSGDRGERCAHTLGLSEFSSRWNDDLEIGLILRPESQTNFATAENAVEHEVGNSFRVRHAVGRMPELVLARFSSESHLSTSAGCLTCCFPKRGSPASLLGQVKVGENP